MDSKNILAKNGHTLGFFFSRGVSLEKWLQSGLYSREVLIYKAHMSAGFFSQMFWFTYGYEDIELSEKLKKTGQMPGNITVVPAPRAFKWFGKFSSALYMLLLPIWHRTFISKCDVLKTNQMDGSIAALIAGKIWKKPVFLRTGYTLSKFLRRSVSKNSTRFRLALINERVGHQLATKFSVTSLADFQYFAERGFNHSEKTKILPNYVDDEFFLAKPLLNRNHKRLLFVGRFNYQKNLFNLILACAELNLGLDLVGQGEDRAKLDKYALKHSVDLNWLGILPNASLPQLFSSYTYFVLPSHWEGMPKSLLEAMATGLVCIGTRVEGISEVIDDSVNGFLADSVEAPDIARAIQRAQKSDLSRISNEAKKTCNLRYSLSSVLREEQSIFSSILA